MRSLLGEVGYSCWLDIENPPVEDGEFSISRDAQLGMHLRTAMQRCKFVLFFEASAALSLQVGGRSIHCTRWQERELRMSEQDRLVVLYHSANPPVLGFGRDRHTVEYRSFYEAIEKIMLWGFG